MHIPEHRQYHHGDLRPALIQAGLEVAREGGLEALRLREVTRRVGVSPNAAYRHFADQRALVVAVALETQGVLAQAMVAEIAKIPTALNESERAIATLRAVGMGYIRFALSEPGWFNLAFLTRDEERVAGPTVTVQASIPEPFALLMSALDGMVAAGVITPERREHAEWACWSTVHGFADIATRGPLREQSPEVIDALAGLAVTTVIDGVLAPREA